MLLEELISVGYSKAQATTLVENKGFHHKRKTAQELTDLFSNISSVYGVSIDKVKRAILTHPQFAGYDHQRVVSQGIEVYGSKNEDKVKRAILTHPQFAGYDHQRVVRQKTRLGRIARLSNKDSINMLLEKPVLTSYSAKRYLAAFDVARQLEREGFPQNREMLNSFLTYFANSPYIPDTKRKRISQIQSDKEPPLLRKMRIYLQKVKNAKEI